MAYNNIYKIVLKISNKISVNFNSNNITYYFIQNKIVWIYVK